MSLARLLGLLLALGCASTPRQPSAPPFPFDAAEASRYQKDAAQAMGLPVAFAARSGLRFVFVPPGTFLMGSPEDEPGRKPDERRRPVTLTRPFYLGRCEVTVGEFRRFVAATGYETEVEKAGGGNAHDAKAVWEHTPGTSWKKAGYAGPFTPTDDHPVVHVSHLDARAYCDWLNAAAPEPGWTYGLPTEAEWEWACRAGSGGPSNGAGANIGDRALRTVHPEWPRRTTAEDDGHAFAAPVGTYRPNAFGLHDMLGNVWEFCSTKHGAYPAGPATDPGDLGDRESYDVRGGGWSNEPADVRCAARNADPPKFGHSNLGFRVALHR